MITLVDNRRDYEDIASIDSSKAYKMLNELRQG